MKCTFYRPANVNLDEYENIIGKLEYDLKTLTLGKTYDLDIYNYVWHLVQDAKPFPKHPDICFWGMDEAGHMPSDARRDYFYRPTYIATAFLMQALLKYPELEDENKVNWEFGDLCVRQLFQVLPKALKACTTTGFSGHGYNALEGKLDTMELFLMAGAADFVEKYPDLCPEFTQLLKGTIDSLREPLATGNTKGAWGEDYEEKLSRYCCMLLFLQPTTVKGLPHPTPS